MSESREIDRGHEIVFKFVGGIRIRAAPIRAAAGTGELLFVFVFSSRSEEKKSDPRSLGRDEARWK